MPVQRRSGHPIATLAPPALSARTRSLDVVTEPQPFDVHAALAPIRRRWWLVLVLFVLAVTTTYLYSEGQTPKFRASTDIVIRSSQAEQALTGTSAATPDDRTVAVQARLLKTLPVAERVASRIRFEGSPQALLAKVTVVPQAGTDLVTITGRDSNPVRAARIANGFAKSFIEDRGREIKRRIAGALGAAREELANTPSGSLGRGARQAAQARIQDLRVAESLPAANAVQLDAANPPGQPYAPRPKRSATFAGVLALLFGCALVYVLELFDRRFKRLEEVEQAYGQPTLAVVPHAGEGDLVGAAHDPAIREAFRTLRLSLSLASPDVPLKKILVTSAVAGEGKSTVVRNLAMAYEEAGFSVAVVDADLRRARQFELFGLTESPGLTDLLGARHKLEETMRMAPATDAMRDVNGNGSLASGGGSVAVLTSGPTPPNPPALLATQRFAALLDELAGKYDVVLVDSTPLLPVGDAFPVLGMVDGVLLVVRLERLSRDQAKRALDLLHRLPHAPLLGLVASDVEAERAQYDYGAYYSKS